MAGYRQLDASVTAEARPLLAQSRVRHVGSDLVICETRVPDLNIELRSTYGVRDAVPYVKRLVLGAGVSGTSAGRSEGEQSSPHPADEERCVLDHFSHLRGLLQTIAKRVRIEIHSWHLGYPWTRRVPDESASRGDGGRADRAARQPPNGPDDRWHAHAGRPSRDPRSRRDSPTGGRSATGRPLVAS